MQKVDIAELRRLHEAATTGKWFAFRLSVASASLLVGDIVCQPPDEDCEESLKQWPHNADYISAVRNALPALLDELEAARLEMRRQASVIAEYKDEVRRLQEVVNAPTYREALAMLAGKDARDRRMKAIGAAEWIEKAVSLGRDEGLNYLDISFSYLLEIAAQLRREAGE